MKNVTILLLCLVLFAVKAGYAKENETQVKDDAKALSGMSIVGNDEAPKSLYIVPWKSSEVDAETGLNMQLDKEYSPVDRDEFKRKLDYYYVSTTSKAGR